MAVLLALFLVFSSHHVQAGTGLRTDVAPKGLLAVAQKLSDGRKLVLLATQSSDSRYPSSSDLKELGFEGQYSPAAPNFDPSFLVISSESGVESVYSFDMGSFMTPAEASRLGSPKMREQFPHHFDHFGYPEREAGLPPKLLNVPHAHRNLNTRFGTEIVLTAAQFFQGGPIAAIALLLIKQLEKIKDRQAAFLSQAIDLELRGQKFPELEAVLSHDELEQLGSSLLIRYNPEAQWRGVIVPPSKDIEYYKKTMAKRDVRTARHMEDLAKHARSHGLVLSSLGPGFALLSIPRKEILLHPERPVKPEIQKWLDRFKDLPESAGDLIPYRIYALDEQMKKHDLVHFDFPLRAAIQSQIMDFTHLAMGIGFNYLDLIPGIIAGAASFFGEMVPAWFGESFAEYKMATYGRLDANLKLGVADLSDKGLDGQKLVVEVLFEHARLVGVPEAEVKRIREEFTKVPDADLGFAISSLTSELIEIEGRVATMIETKDLEKVRETKRIHLARLGNWLHQQRALP